MAPYMERQPRRGAGMIHNANNPCYRQPRRGAGMRNANNPCNRQPRRQRQHATRKRTILRTAAPWRWHVQPLFRPLNGVNVQVLARLLLPSTCWTCATSWPAPSSTAGWGHASRPHPPWRDRSRRCRDRWRRCRDRWRRCRDRWRRCQDRWRRCRDLGPQWQQLGATHRSQ